MTMDINYVKDNEDHKRKETHLRYRRDSRLRWIYEQYHSGKTVILDDFKYLYRKDPEGCRRLLRSIIDKNYEVHKEEQRQKTEWVTMECISQLEQAVKEAEGRLELKSEMEAMESKLTLESVKESLANVKEMVKVMEQEELIDMMDHLYEVSDLREQYEDELRGWMMILEVTDRYYTPVYQSKLEFYA